MSIVLMGIGNSLIFFNLTDLYNNNIAVELLNLLSVKGSVTKPPRKPRPLIGELTIVVDNSRSGARNLRVSYPVGGSGKIAGPSRLL